MAAIDQNTDKPARRKEPKDVRRKQLIEATIDSIAKRGFASTTMADVADGAGLSRGIVNFHFESKEKLLAEALRFLVEVYGTHWQNAVDTAGPRAADRLWALVQSDFSRKVCNKRYISAWFGLRAEAQSRPTYRLICGHHDESFVSLLNEICTELVEDGNYDADPVRLASVIDATLEGLWLQVLMGPDGMSRQSGLACAVEQLAAMFPKHFTRDGPLT